MGCQGVFTGSRTRLQRALRRGSTQDTIRLLLALSAHFDYVLDQVDIKAAFLNGELEEKIYLEPPEGSDIPAGSILRLCKSLYGLKQSPRCFNDKLKQWLISQGFVQAKADACLFIRKRSTSIIILSVHVDDQLISSNNRAELNEFKTRSQYCLRMLRWRSSLLLPRFQYPSGPRKQAHLHVPRTLPDIDSRQIRYDKLQTG